jgi:hypothetical protein
MEKASISETSVKFFRAVQRSIPEDSHTDCREKLKSEQGTEHCKRMPVVNLIVIASFISTECAFHYTPYAQTSFISLEALYYSYFTLSYAILIEVNRVTE